MTRMLVLIAGLVLAASASAGGKRLAYADYVTDETVREIKFYQLYNWHRSTDKAVVLWTKPSEAYMISLAHNCDELRSPRVVIEVGGVAGVPGRLRVNDDLLVGPIKCRVTEIRPLDLVAMKADRAAAKKN